MAALFMSNNKFNVRVYGVLINDNDQVLLSDEKRFGKVFTKFPGGGLEFGEGTKDCLIREMREELDLDVEIIDHFYTTDFFQQSAFSEIDQIISIYYLISSSKISSISVQSQKCAFDKNTKENQLFRWVSLEEICEKDLTFPIDKVVAEKLKRR